MKPLLSRRVRTALSRLRWPGCLAAGALVALLVGCQKMPKAASGSSESASQPGSRQERPSASSVRGQPPSLAALSGPPQELKYEDCAVITKRDIFKPLVAEPVALGAKPNFPNPQHKGGPAPGRMGIPTRGPTEDLAVTGFTEVGGRLAALIENITTGEGRYVQVGDLIFGLQVVAIKRGRVVFLQGGKRYEVTAGEKTIAETQVAAAPKEEKKGEKPAAPPPPMPTGGMDLTRFIPPGMSAAQLRAMYERYKEHLTPEQRAQAEEYIRNRERSEGH